MLTQYLHMLSSMNAVIQLFLVIVQNRSFTQRKFKCLKRLKQEFSKKQLFLIISSDGAVLLVRTLAMRYTNGIQSLDKDFNIDLYIWFTFCVVVQKIVVLPFYEIFPNRPFVVSIFRGHGPWTTLKGIFQLEIQISRTSSHNKQHADYSLCCTTEEQSSQIAHGAYIQRLRVFCDFCFPELLKKDVRH